MIFIDGFIIYMSIYAYSKWKGKPLSSKSQWLWAFILTFGKLFVWLILSFSMLNFDGGYREMLTNDEKANLVPLMNNYTFFFPVWSIYYSQLASYRRNYDDSFLKEQNAKDYIRENLPYCLNVEERSTIPSDKCEKLLETVIVNEKNMLDLETVKRIHSVEHDYISNLTGFLSVGYLDSAKSSSVLVEIPKKCASFYFEFIYLRILYPENYKVKYLDYLQEVYLSDSACQSVKLLFITELMQLYDGGKYVKINDFELILEKVFTDKSYVFHIKTRLNKFSKQVDKENFVSKVICNIEDRNELYKEYCVKN